MPETELLTKFEYAHIQLLPEYNGTKNCSLDYFLARCDSFLANFKRDPSVPNAAIINDFLFNVIKSKLKGDACSVLDLDANLNYDRLKEKLIRKYGDVRDERLLTQEIANCYQKLNEQYPHYHERLESLTLQCSSLYKINYQGAILELKLRELEELSLNTFKAGVLEPYRSYLRYASVTDLAQALRVCRSYDNDRAHESYMDQLRGTQRISQSKTLLPTGHNPFTALKPAPFGRIQNQYVPQTKPNLPTSQNFQARPFPNQQPRPNWNPNFPQNPRPFVHSNQPPSKPSTTLNRPYPTPNNIGRRFAPLQQNPTYPKPMSGVSTVRGNVNSHAEFLESPQLESPKFEEYFSTETENETQTEVPCFQEAYDYNYPPNEYNTQDIASYFPNEHVHNSSTDHQQDFHLAQQSQSKT